MRYLVEPRERRYIQGYDFLSFARNIGSKVEEKLLKQGHEAEKIAGKRALKKTAEATGHLVGQKIADKITQPQKREPSQQEGYIPPDKRQQIIDELRLASKI